MDARRLSGSSSTTAPSSLPNALILFALGQRIPLRRRHQGLRRLAYSVPLASLYIDYVPTDSNIADVPSRWHVLRAVLQGLETGLADAAAEGGRQDESGLADNALCDGTSSRCSPGLVRTTRTIHASGVATDRCQQVASGWRTRTLYLMWVLCRYCDSVCVSTEELEAGRRRVTLVEMTSTRDQALAAVA